MRDKVEDFIAEATEQWDNGLQRDDLYHATVRFAAKNNLDRYDLWVRLVQQWATTEVV